MLFWNGQKMVSQPDKVIPFNPPPDPFQQTVPKVNADSVAVALQSGVSVPAQTWGGPVTNNAALLGTLNQTEDGF